MTNFTAMNFFAAKLAFETDPADLAADRAAGRAPRIIDVRSAEGWDQGHIPGAVHIPLDAFEGEMNGVVPELDAEIVVYCWGPGCNGSTRGALKLSQMGYTNVKELIGGFEYWAREGLAIETSSGRKRLKRDELVAPVPAAHNL